MRRALLAIDLFCGLGGWADGLLAEDFDVVGFDIERHEYGKHHYPGQLVIQDVRTLHGSQFKGADLIVASPPCQFFSYCAMPWTRAKALAAEVRADPARLDKELELFCACFRLQREASEAAGRHIPLIVENVRGAIPWVGRSRWNFGSFHLWGDVPALMPTTFSAKRPGHDWNHKVAGFRFDGSGGSFQSAAVARMDGEKTVAHPNVRNGHAHTKHLTNPGEHGVKHSAGGAATKEARPVRYQTKRPRRKAASALIAKIPFELARHIGHVFSGALVVSIVSMPLPADAHCFRYWAFPWAQRCAPAHRVDFSDLKRGAKNRHDTDIPLPDLTWPGAGPEPDDDMRAKLLLRGALDP